MNDTPFTLNDTGNELKIRELTLTEAATVRGASRAPQYLPAPQPGLYVDEVITQGQRVPAPS